MSSARIGGDSFALGVKGLVCVLVLLSWLGYSVTDSPPSTRPDFSLSFSTDAYLTLEREGGNVNGTLQWYQDYNASALLWVGFSQYYYGEGYHLELDQQKYFADYNDTDCTSCHNNQCCGQVSCGCSESSLLQMWTYYENTTYAGQCGDDGQGSTWYTNYDLGHGLRRSFTLCYDPIANVSHLNCQP
eukprot:TRINITY_DN1134_c0_g1_i3.p1 TRINITY_DN1134_c0_g1~~TRINITY_DN1134_c0_g1_i3.p1  ORF type:complete len:198 (+),score=18.09 TRINITY_DN1134_c0_g1_i3:35-595(+)